MILYDNKNTKKGGNKMDIRLCDNCQFDKYLEIVKRQKVGIEFQTFADPFYKNVKKEVARENELSKGIKHRSLHAPFPDLNLGTKMPGLRKETMKYFNHGYKIAKELGCDSVIVHNGYIPRTYSVESWVRKACEFWKEFFADKDDSITMMVENQFEDNSRVMLEEIDAVHDQRLKICLDVGHAHCNADMPVYDWIKTLGNRIGYMHLHNNHGKYNKKVENWDEHNGFDNGTIDFKKIMKLVKQHCPKAILAVETRFEGAESAIEFLKKTTK